ncbi:MAG: diguanylate cyclase [Deltaproteobacteria bacterium]|nr:diguanylate cyclase [Deltaproteobacteria bacterium]
MKATRSQEPARAVLVLDAEGAEGRPLADSVEVAGFRSQVVPAFDELQRAFRDGAAPLAVVAYEALWPAPQRALRTLREVCPAARLVVAYADGSPRIGLGKRLWSEGLIDYWVSRSAGPREFAKLLTQAAADLAADDSGATSERPSPPAAAGWGGALRELDRLGRALNNTRRLDELLREVRRRTRSLVEAYVVQVLLHDETAPKLFSFPSAPVQHEVSWRLVESACAALSGHLVRPLDPLEVAAFQSPPLDAASSEAVSDALSAPPLHVPLFAQGVLVGCLSVLPFPGRPWQPEHEALIRLLAHQLAAALRGVELLAATEASAEVDELTGLRNRRALSALLPQEWRRAERFGLDLTLLVIDVDRFAELNERLGYATGDEILRQIATLIANQLRTTDHLIHLGADRFLCVLTGEGPSEAAVAAERVLLTFKQHPVLTDSPLGPVHVACSAAVASRAVSAASQPEELLELAEAALRRAKDAGGGRTAISPAPARREARDTEEIQIDEKRRAARLAADLPVRYLEIPDLEGHLTEARSININASGIALLDPQARLRQHHYALLYVEGAQSPILARVVWTADSGDGPRSAGLTFLTPEELVSRVRAVERVRSAPVALVVTDNPRTWEQVERVLIAARYQMLVLKSGMPLPSTEELSEFSLVVVGENALHSWFGERLAAVRLRLRGRARIVVINESEDRGEALRTIASHEIQHFVAHSDRSDEALFATLNKLLVGEYFGMQKYLLWGTSPKSWTIRKREDKEQVLDGIRQVAREVYCHPRLSDLLIAALDEMLINAMYGGGAPGRDAPDRVTVECGTDGRLLAVSVVDDRGNFAFEDLYRALDQGLSRAAEGIPGGAASARIGFRTMLDCLSQLAINVELGRRTEVIGIVDLRKPFREYRRSIPTLGLFTTADSKSDPPQEG